MSSLDVVAVIPARSGSRSIPHKNIRSLAGKPLMAHTIEQARASRHITRTIVSTDSPLYAEIARAYGAETPFLRPADYAQDLSTDLDVMTHALRWLAEREGRPPAVCVHLRPTYPLRRIRDIDAAVELLLAHPEADAVRSVTPAREIPYKMWRMSPEGWLTPAATLPDVPDAYNAPRQALPAVYLQNASIDVVRSRVILEQRSMTGRRILGYPMPGPCLDIDREEDWERVARALAGSEAQSPGAQPAASGPKTFCIDVDGVLGTLVPHLAYEQAQPLPQNIRVVNELFTHGHRIVLHTARGAVSGRDWAELTRAQLAAWGVRYHELRFGKPAADYYVDDRSISLEAVRAALTAGAVSTHPEDHG